MKRSRKYPPPAFGADGYQDNITDLNGHPLPDLKTVKAHSFHQKSGPTRKSAKPRAS